MRTPGLKIIYFNIEVFKSFLSNYWIYCFLIIYPCCISTTIGQNYTYNEGRYELFSTDHYPMMQDHEGFIWGLNKEMNLFRFDGFEYRYFYVDPNNPKGLLSSQHFLRVPYLDRENKIWFFIDGEKLARYNPVDQSFEYFDGKMEELAGLKLRGLRRILEDDQDNIWVFSTIGIFQYHKTTKLFQYYKIFSPSYIIEENGEYFIGSPWYVKKLNLASGEFSEPIIEFDPLIKTPIQTFFPFGEKNKYLLSGYDKPYILDLQKKLISPYDLQLKPKEQIIISTRRENLFIVGTNKGRVLVYDNISKKHSNIFQTPDSTLIKYLFIDHKGIIWISSIGGQSYKVFPDQGIHISEYSIKPPGGTIWRHLFQNKNNTFVFTEEGVEIVRGNTSHANEFNTNFKIKDLQFYYAGPIKGKEDNIWILYKEKKS